MFKFLFGSDNSKRLKKYNNIASKVNSFEESISVLSDDELKKKTGEFKNRLKSGEKYENILPETFAVVREVSKRTLNQRHYDVQILAGIAMFYGDIAELQTGEGKTLVATLPVYLSALGDDGVHVVTVNDYLSRRDAVWMGQIYDFLGLSVGVIQEGNNSFIYDPEHKELDKLRDEKGFYKVVYDFLKPCTRKESYIADITYGANNEFVFDYLRDNTVYSKDNIAQRELNYVIVDEVDSVLIDETRSPLIISQPVDTPEGEYRTFAKIVRNLIEEEDYEIDRKANVATITDSGIGKVEKITGIDNFYVDASHKQIHMLEKALQSEAVLIKDKHYVVQGDEVVIVDEFTGRLQPSRRWRDGLHQAIEAKENLSIKNESRTIASITYQNYFRMYKKISGMTGTAHSSREEFYKVYGTEVTQVPTHRPKKRIDHQDKIFKNNSGKNQAIAEKVKELNEKGQPVLIGTASIEKNEEVHKVLNKAKINNEVLNAKNHEREGEIIAQAGRKGAVTIATNLAGRGVDIKLGGADGNDNDYNEVKKLGGLFVLGTERHEARRIDDQLRGRSGRQGDEGETQFFVSMDDSLLRAFGTERMKTIMDRFGLEDNQPIENRMISKSIESAQKRVEGHNFDSRRYALEYDNVLNDQRSEVYTKRREILFSSNEDVGKRIIEIAEDAKRKKDELGDDAFYNASRLLLLQVLDSVWSEHLELMEYSRSSVSLRSYGQMDPMIEYKKEAKALFDVFFDKYRDIVRKNIDQLNKFVK